MKPSSPLCIARMAFALAFAWFSGGVFGQAIYTSYSFSTTAGTPQTSNTNGRPNISQNPYPLHVAVDNSGIVYVSTSDGGIRRITPDGHVAPFVGLPGYLGYVDGFGTAARFGADIALAVDPKGFLFAGDIDNAVVRAISPEGAVVTIAGTPGVRGAQNGYASQAQFNAPAKIAFDGLGSLFIADWFGGSIAIRQMTRSGFVSTLDARPAAAGFPVYGTVARDPAGNIYYSTSTEVIRIAADGSISIFAGSSQMGASDGPGRFAQFGFAAGIAADPAGNLFIADRSNNAIRKITPSGFVSTLAGAPGKQGSLDGHGSAALFHFPSDISVDGSGTAYVADYGNSSIRIVSPSGDVSTLATLPFPPTTPSVSVFNDPRDIALDNAGNAYVADSLNHVIRRITTNGAVELYAGAVGIPGSADGPPSAARFAAPSGIAVDDRGYVYIADTDNNTIRQIAPGGLVKTIAGTAGIAGNSDGAGTNASFRRPVGIAVHPTGVLYIADAANSSIRKISTDGLVSTIAKNDRDSGSRLLIEPTGVAVDLAGTVYVVDHGSHTLLTVDSTGKVRILAGASDVEGSSDGFGTNALFQAPFKVALAASGGVFVTDWGNNLIRHVSGNGSVTTLGGVAGIAGSADGIGGDARFDRPAGIASDRVGNIVITDSGNNTVRTGLRFFPPRMATIPTSLRVTNGVPIMLSASAIGLGQIQYQWRFNGANIPGASESNFLLPNPSLGDSGEYSVVARDPFGSVTSSPPAVVAVISLAPVITQNPIGQTVYSGAGVQLQATVWSGAAPAFQWQFDGTNVAGATNGSLSIESAAGSDIGRYTLIASNGFGASTSAPARLAVVHSPPIFVAPPLSVGVVLGQSFAMEAGAEGSQPLSFQWQLNGAPIPGATQSVYRISSFATNDAGDYIVVASNAFGSAASLPASLTSVAPVLPSLPPYGFITAAGSRIPSGSRHYDLSGTDDALFGLAADDRGNLFIADTLNAVIRKITPDGAIHTIAGSKTNFGYADGLGTNSTFSLPKGIAVDRNGNVFVADDATIRMIEPDGNVTTIAGTVGQYGNRDGPSLEAQFGDPQGLALDAAGNIYVADAKGAIRVVSKNGTVSTLAGRIGHFGSVDGQGTNALFASPWGVAIDSKQSLYVTDFGNGTIRKITPDARVTTVAGLAGVFGLSDGFGDKARFSRFVEGIAVDAQGNLYVADLENSALRIVGPGGSVVTLGSPPISQAADGFGNDIHFGRPAGIAIDSSRKVFVTEAAFNYGQLRIGVVVSDPSFQAQAFNGQLLLTWPATEKAVLLFQNRLTDALRRPAGNVLGPSGGLYFWEGDTADPAAFFQLRQ